MVTTKSLLEGLGVGAVVGAASYAAGMGADYIAHMGNNVFALTSAVDAVGQIGKAASDYLSAIGFANNLNDPAVAVRFGGYLTAAAAGLMHAFCSDSAISREYSRGTGIHESAELSPYAAILGLKRAA